MTTKAVGPGRPPERSRFRKGRSGNPAGRPPGKTAKSKKAVSAFDVVFDQTVTVTQSGVERELSAEEALQLQTFRKAIAGDRPARRQVLKMIAKREKWIAARTPVRKAAVTLLTEPVDPRNVDDALVILGIAIEDPAWSPPLAAPGAHEMRLRLAPWAVQAALSRRRGGRALTDREIDEIRRCTLEAETLRWPRGTET